MELTTFELIENLRRAEISDEEIQMFNEFLNACDLVKFAKYKPTTAKNSANLDKAFEIVEQTKLVYEESEELETEVFPKDETLAENALHHRLVIVASVESAAAVAGVATEQADARVGPAELFHAILHLPLAAWTFHVLLDLRRTALPQVDKGRLL